MNPDNPFFDVHYHAHELAKKVTHLFYVWAPGEKDPQLSLLTDDRVQELREQGYTVKEDTHE